MMMLLRDTKAAPGFVAKLAEGLWQSWPRLCGKAKAAASLRFTLPTFAVP